MFKKSLFSLLFVSFVSVAHAETCPSVNQIQQNYFNGWQAFDRDSGEPASAMQIASFVESVQTFSLGYFTEGALEGEAQCYYKGNSGSDYLNIYLARQDLQTDDTSSAWVIYKDGRKECVSTNVSDCRFKEK
jgi:hypothetical protein